MNIKIENAGVHHIALRVKDYNKSFKLYTEGFGFKLAYAWGEKAERVCLLDIGDGSYLELFDGGDDSVQGNFWHLAFKTTDVDTAFKNAIANGAIADKEPFDTVINAVPEKIHVRIAFVKGFDGELLEFFGAK